VIAVVIVGKVEEHYNKGLKRYLCFHLMLSFTPKTTDSGMIRLLIASKTNEEYLGRINEISANQLYTKFEKISNFMFIIFLMIRIIIVYLCHMDF
jgi:hypothetical protein